MVTKVVSGTAAPTSPADYSFTVTGPESYSNSFTITGADSHTLTGLLPGDYTVTENVPAKSTFAVDDAEQTATVAANQTAQLTFTNIYTPPATPTGILRIQKSVSGTDEDDTFTFTVTGPNEYQNQVTLHGSAFIDLNNVPTGDYSVTEINIPSGYALGGENPKTVTVAAGTTTSLVLFTNTYTPPAQDTGSLTITKVVSGTAAPETPAVYSFTVAGPESYTNSFMITGADSHTLTGLLPGDYTVTENVPSESAFAVDNAAQTTTVAANQTAQLTFTNTYTPPAPDTGNLTVRKIVTGDAPAGDEFTFNIRRVTAEVSVAAFAPFTLEAGESKTFTDLHPGQYIITEDTYPSGYTPDSVSKEVTVNAGENTDVTFTNVYRPSEPERPVPTPTYTVSYHPNGGSGTVPIDMNRYYPGDKAWLKSGAGLYKSNCVFAGWSLINGTHVSDPYTMGKSDVTFFAIWVPVKAPKTGDESAPYGIILIAGAIPLAALNLLYEIKKRRAQK